LSQLNANINLQTLGWNMELQNHFSNYEEQGYSVGRVALEHKRTYRVYTTHGLLLSEISGKMHYEASERQDYPAVGDWVVIFARPEEQRATIHAILPRKSKFSRKKAGVTTEEQLVATNVDTVFLVTALNEDFNIRRLEIYLIMAWESGANPVIILSKADLCETVEEKVQEVESVALVASVHVISAKTGLGIDELAPYLTEGSTIAVLGSSGVGKSTLTNILFGDTIQDVQDVREGDDKGRHTTTHRELLVLPKGGILIDTPGMRELQLWEADSSLDHSFADVETLALQCQFNDCRHESEPNCAVKEAIENGSLDHARFQSYLKLQRELAYLERKADKRARLEEKKKWKKISGDRTKVNRKR
jgi:ribosome biogenesis GTPase / thiamine phosphate phosphatase